MEGVGEANLKGTLNSWMKEGIFEQNVEDCKSLQKEWRGSRWVEGEGWGSKGDGKDTGRLWGGSKERDLVE